MRRQLSRGLSSRSTSWRSFQISGFSMSRRKKIRQLLFLAREFLSGRQSPFRETPIPVENLFLPLERATGVDLDGERFDLPVVVQDEDGLRRLPLDAATAPAPVELLVVDVAAVDLGDLLHVVVRLVKRNHLRPVPPVLDGFFDGKLGAADVCQVSGSAAPTNLGQRHQHQQLESRNKIN